MVKLTVHAITQGVCSLSGKEGDVLNVSFDDGTTKEANLSLKSLQALLKMKVAQAEKPAAKPAMPVRPAAAPAVNAIPAFPMSNPTALMPGNGAIGAK